jgi:AAA15 family ATPase/GTPase
LNNHSVLSVCSKASLKEDIAPFNELHRWVKDNYHEVDGDGEKGIVAILKEAYGNPQKRRFFNLMLQKADLNILEFRPITEDRILPEDVRKTILTEDFPGRVKEDILLLTKQSISFINQAEDGNFEIPLKWQSKGTLKYIRILDALYNLVTGAHVYYLDELGEDLHNDLLYYYLNVFIFNSDKSQLIITSQETTLLSQDLINENRGVVWFVEKNKETASSEYSRGDSFGLHKNLSLYNSYRIGRLGAKPELGSIFINLDD